MIALAVFLLAVAILALAGLPLVLALPRALWRRTILLAPLLGVVLLVALLHLAIPFVGVGAAAVPVVILLLAGLAVTLVLRRPWRGLTRSGWRPTIAVAGASLLAGILGMLPSVLHGLSGLVQPAANNDAFYFVAVSRWFAQHSAFQIPHVGTSPALGTDSPAFGPAFSTLDQSLRFGQELVQTWLASVTGIDLIYLFTPLLAVWFAMIVPAMWFAGGVLGLAGRTRAVVPLATVTAASLASLTARQNADALLGVSLAVLAVSTFVAALDDAGSSRLLAGRMPLWMPALAITATIGVYSEYIPVLALILATVTLWRRRATIVPALTRAVLVLAASLLVGVFAWFRAINALIFFGTLSSTNPGPLAPSDALFGVLGVLDALPRHAHGVVLVAVGVAIFALAVVVIVGAATLILAATGALRAVGASVGIGGGLFLAFLALRGNQYIYRRASDLILPFLVLVVVAGWSILLARLGRLPFRVAAVVVIIGWVGVNQAVFLVPTLSQVWRDRTVDKTFLQAQQWVQAVQTSRGRNVSVVSADVFDQLWISERLAAYPDVEYPDLRGELGYRGALALQSYWNGTSTRYVLVARGIPYSADPAAIVHRNARFTLLDRAAGQVVVATPFSPNGAWQFILYPDGTLGAVGPFRFLVLTSGDPTATIQFRAAGTGDPISISCEGARCTSSDAAVLAVADSEVIARGATIVTVAPSQPTTDWELTKAAQRAP